MMLNNKDYIEFCNKYDWLLHTLYTNLVTEEIDLTYEEFCLEIWAEMELDKTLPWW